MELRVVHSLGLGSWRDLGKLEAELESSYGLPRGEWDFKQTATGKPEMRHPAQAR